jgi:CheY-like chemotaxis protein
MTKDRLNLKGVRTLVIDSDSFSVTLLTQMLQGFGMDTVRVASSGEQAQAILQKDEFDLCICDSGIPDIAGADLVRWIRRLPTNTRFLPVLVMTSYSAINNVQSLRDSGAHLVMTKPASPQTLFDRIAWVSKPPRPFIECETYIGPDRRFKHLGPPNGVPRRATDLSVELGAAVEPNMSQDEIDSLMRPTRIVAQ